MSSTAILWAFASSVECTRIKLKGEKLVRKNRRLALSRETLANLDNGVSWEKNVRGRADFSDYQDFGRKCYELPDPTGCGPGNGSIYP